MGMKRIAGPLAVVLLLAFATLSACSGGGGSRVAPTSQNIAGSQSVPAAISQRTRMVSLTFTVPAGLGQNFTQHSRSLQYTSPSVMGAVAVQLQVVHAHLEPLDRVHAAGVPWADFVQKRLLDPLEMSSTCFTTSAAARADRR